MFLELLKAHFLAQCLRDDICLATWLQRLDASLFYSGNTSSTHNTLQIKDISNKLRYLVHTYISSIPQEGSVNLLKEGSATAWPADKRHPPTPSSVLDMVEKATAHLIKTTLLNARGMDASYEAGMLWRVVNRFCRRYHLPLSTQYLVVCAGAGAWLTFMTFAQSQGYTPDLVAHISRVHFADPGLRAHVLVMLNRVRLKRDSCLLQDTSETSLSKQKLPLGKTDPRAGFYANIGLLPPRNLSTPGQAKEVSFSSSAQDLSSSHVFDPVDDQTGPLDLFDIVFSALDAPDVCTALLTTAVQNGLPFLVVLAAPLRDDTTVACICAWLRATCTEALLQLESSSTLSNNSISGGAKEGSASLYTLADLSLLLCTLVEGNLFGEVVLALQIFAPLSPLLWLARFNHAFYTRAFSEAEGHLGHFVTFMTDDAINDNAETIRKFEGRAWLINTAVEMVAVLLRGAASDYEKKHLLRLLAEARFSDRYIRLHHTSVILGHTGLNISPTARPEETTSLLITRHLFDEARAYASVHEDMDKGVKDEITLGEVEFRLSQVY